MNDSFCCYCGKRLFKSSECFTLEHLIPKSKGGNNSSENKKPCCLYCNRLRKNQNLSRFRNYIIYLKNNNILIENYTKYDFEIMIENISCVMDYIKENKHLLTKTNN